MASPSYASRYPAGREFEPVDPSVPNDTSVLDASGPSSTANDPQPSDGLPVDVDLTSSNDSGPTPAPPDVLPTTTGTSPCPDVPPTTGVPPQSTVVPDPPLNASDPPVCRNQDPPPSSTPAPAPNPYLTPSSSPERYVSTPTGGCPTPGTPGSPNSDTDTSTQSLPEPTSTDYFIPSSALNNSHLIITRTLETDTTPASPPNIDPAPNLPTSSTVTPFTDTLDPTPTAALTQEGTLATDSTGDNKYIIGGAIGGVVLLVVLLALICCCCCRKRRAKRDVECSGGGHSEGQPGYGQFTSCNHATCDRNNGQLQMEQKTPLKPFVLRSDSRALTAKEGQQQHVVSLNRRGSAESQKSAGSDVSTSSAYSSGSESYQRGKKKSLKRPPPLKLTALVTPVISGPQNNPRTRVDRSSPPDSDEVPTIVVEPPQSETSHRMRRR